MILEVKQTKKELFAAEFDILLAGNSIGHMNLVGSLGSMEGKWNGIIFDKQFELEYAKRNFPIKDIYTFRPYQIAWSDMVRGYVYQTEQKDGFFSKMEYHQLILDNQQYNMYPISFGKEGSKNPVYRGDEQIALVEKECVVYDDLHHYEIIAIDESSAMITLMFVCYMYVNAAYKPGVQIKKSVSKEFSVTTNKKMKQKYDPNFKEHFIDII